MARSSFQALPKSSIYYLSITFFSVSDVSFNRDCGFGDVALQRPYQKNEYH